MRGVICRGDLLILVPIVLRVVRPIPTPIWQHVEPGKKRARDDVRVEGGKQACKKTNLTPASKSTQCTTTGQAQQGRVKDARQAQAGTHRTPHQHPRHRHHHHRENVALNILAGHTHTNRGMDCMSMCGIPTSNRGRHAELTRGTCSLSFHSRAKGMGWRRDSHGHKREHSPSSASTRLCACRRRSSSSGQGYLHREHHDTINQSINRSIGQKANNSTTTNVHNWLEVQRTRRPRSRRISQCPCLSAGQEGGGITVTHATNGKQACKPRAAPQQRIRHIPTEECLKRQSETAHAPSVPSSPKPPDRHIGVGEGGGFFV
jgi:hypothetical protein